MNDKPDKPKTDRDWALYRASLACKVGRDVLDGKTPQFPGASQTEHALYSLLSAVEDIAEAMREGGNP